MNDRVLFSMHFGFRRQLIEKHEFYVSQAKSRLLDQFTDEEISKEADRVADESWEVRGRNFNPDYDDPADGAQEAFEDGAWRYELLVELRDNVRMNIIAGFFHEWEKNLRQWLVDQVQFWHRGEGTKSKIWRANFDELYELLGSFGWNLKITPWFIALDSCRLVVNVHKHGDGPSLTQLGQTYPKLMVHPLADFLDDDALLLGPISHKYMKVSDADLDVFADAISQFWRGLPENVLNSQIENPPGWLLKSIKKDDNSTGAN